MIALYRCDTAGCQAGPWPPTEHAKYFFHNNACNGETLEAEDEVEEAKKVLAKAIDKLKHRQVKIVII